MKEVSVSKEIEWLGTYYRVTRHINAEVIQIEELVPNGFWGKHNKVYKTLYMGNLQPLEEAINFFKESRK